MRSLKRAALAACAASAITLAAYTPAVAQEAEVIHWWTSGGESAALQEFVSRFEAAGGTWVDTAIAGGTNARTAGINRIVGGDAPTAMQFNTGRQFEEVAAGGLLNDIEAVASRGGWRDLIPASFVDAISYDGEIYAVPVNIHGQNWMFYNNAVLEEAGVAPPQTWEDVLAAAEKIEAAGKIPFAQGGEPWQERTLFNAVLAGHGGPELYDRLYAQNDVAALDTEEFRAVADVFGRLRAIVDEGSPGRSWNETTNLVVTGRAAMQLMGDWAKGEFLAAGQTPGEEYGCALVGANEALIIGGDVFVFPATDDEAQRAAQEMLAEVMFSPEAQIAFNNVKGSIPVRSDVDVSGMDACAQRGAEVMSDPAKQVPQVNLVASSDLVGAVDDVITQYWNDPSMDADAFVARFREAMEIAG
ncbi:ABC transporter substrate-binding protein [Salinarimonas ramus]|uniref:Probable sugar-binding periplasmic protein n=1 Tax=Salinarimonas ramus TaxID=690164 RepID=A0A917QA98_9HYPH|nr:ABC transporter substrate-binding protein [Salinarimonas ramus]GGK39807.1 sugar ABC transporter substrate-binding protein [Salinarimonas ramus]